MSVDVPHAEERSSRRVLRNATPAGVVEGGVLPNDTLHEGEKGYRRGQGGKECLQSQGSMNEKRARSSRRVW
jgi:hypothetical protein